MPDIVDQQQPNSPFYYLKLLREAERNERDPFVRAYYDYLKLKGLHYVSPERDFLCAVEALKHYFTLKPKYRNASVYPMDTNAVAIKHATDETA